MSDGSTPNGPAPRRAGWQRSPQAALAVIALALAAAVLSSLSGCGSGDAPLARVIAAVGSDRAPLSEESALEVARFNAVFREYAAVPDDATVLGHFEDAFRRVRSGYVREVADRELIDSAIKGVRDSKPAPGQTGSRKLVEAALHTMVSSLDPHSAYLNPDEFRESFVSTKGEFGGIGIEVSAEDGLIKVVSPIEDTPAYRAGVKAGDLITHVDGEDIKGRGLMHAVNRMRGPPGTDVRLTIARAALPPFEVRMTRAVIKVRSVRWSLEGDIGYVRVVRFTERVDEKLDEAMKALRERAGRNLRGIVLDLRNNPGGLLDQSVHVADAFLDAGLIVSVRGRRGPGRSYEAERGDIARGLPMVVLINGGSASASEIVASALQFHGRAIVMGGRSFGKGSVQTIAPLPAEGALRLTTALYYAPTGATIQARGVEPDIELVTAEAKAAPAESADEAKARRRREADLPGALPAVGATQSRPHPAVAEAQCRPAGEKDDRTLGCAIALLKAGSARNFLAEVGARPAM